MIDSIKKHSFTAIVVIVAIALAAWKYWDYLHNPWTRNGMVRAIVIQVSRTGSLALLAWDLTVHYVEADRGAREDSHERYEIPGP